MACQRSRGLPPVRSTYVRRSGYCRRRNTVVCRRPALSPRLTLHSTKVFLFHLQPAFSPLHCRKLIIVLLDFSSRSSYGVVFSNCYMLSNQVHWDLLPGEGRISACMTIDALDRSLPVLVWVRTKENDAVEWPLGSDGHAGSTRAPAVGQIPNAMSMMVTRCVYPRLGARAGAFCSNKNGGCRPQGRRREGEMVGWDKRVEWQREERREIYTRDPQCRSRRTYTLVSIDSVPAYCSVDRSRTRKRLWTWTWPH